MNAESWRLMSPERAHRGIGLLNGGWTLAVFAQLTEAGCHYQAGATTYELAEWFRMHRVTVSAILKRKGSPLRAQPLSPTQVATAAQILP
jgi:hypothetical protein